MNGSSSRRQPVAGAGIILAVQALGQTFALPIAYAQSVFRIEDLTRVPLAAPHLLGLVNLRGHILAVACLNRRLCADAAPLGVGSLAIEIMIGTETLALAVENVGDVLEARGEHFLTTEEHVDGSYASVSLGALRWGESGETAMTVLDVRALFEFRRGAQRETPDEHLRGA